MPKIGKKNPLRLSLNVLRHGTKSLQSATNHETTKCLNIVGHFCLNVFASTAVIIALASFLNRDKELSSEVPLLLLAVCMWLQLAAARHRTVIPLLGSLIFELVIVGLVVYGAIQSLTSDKHTQFSNKIVPGIWLVLSVVRLVVTFILYKVLTVKNPQFALSTTVFLKPTNTPVTFSSVLAPQDLDPTNPYHSKTVYNINDSHANSHNQTVA